MGNKKKGKRKVIIIVSVIAVIALAGVGITSCVSNTLSSMSSASDNSADTLKIEKQNLTNAISVAGTVESDNLVKITSTLNARVESLNVDIGDYVNEGDVLCVFDSSDIQKEYDDLKASIDRSDAMNQNTHDINQRNLDDAVSAKDIALNQAQRAINDAESARDNAYSKYDDLVNRYNSYGQKKDELDSSLKNIEDENEYQTVYQQYQEAVQMYQSAETEMNALYEQLSTYDSAVQNAYDAYDSAERSADAAIQSCQDTINAEKFNIDNSSQSQLDKLAEQLRKCTVTAPKSGIITSLNVAEGSIPTADAIMSIENTDSLKITVQIKEADILNVKNGLKAVIKTDATGDEEIMGKVSRVVNIISGADPAAQQQGGYTAEISVDDKNSKLLIGMNAKVKIILEEKDNVLAVPYDAVSANKDGDDIVYIACKDENNICKAKAVKVQKGLETDYYTEIISDEIKEGDILLTSPATVYDGKIVRISDDNNDNESDSDTENGD